MMLDSPWAPINFFKIGAFIPSLLAYGLITYISHVFLLEFIPVLFKGESWCVTALLIRAVFAYFSGMSMIMLTKTYLANPGYLPLWLKTPLDHNRQAPVNLVRIYNLRFWIANKIYDFEEFIAPVEDENIEININDTSTAESSVGMIEEETATSRSAG